MCLAFGICNFRHSLSAVLASNRRPSPVVRGLIAHCTASGIYGPRDGSITPGLLKGTNTFITRVQLGDNKPMHEWVYVESAAHAHVLATKALLSTASSHEKQVDGEAFFITDGEPVRFWDLARKLWAASGDKNCRHLDKLIVIPWWPLVPLAILTEMLCFIFTLGRKTPGLSRRHLQYMRFGAWWILGKRESDWSMYLWLTRMMGSAGRLPGSKRSQNSRVGE